MLCAQLWPKWIIEPLHHKHQTLQNFQSWWRHQMETISALLAICAGNSPVPGEFPAQRPVTRSFDVFFALCLNKQLSKQSWGWWFETLSRHYDVTLMYRLIKHYWNRSLFAVWYPPQWLISQATTLNLDNPFWSATFYVKGKCIFINQPTFPWRVSSAIFITNISQVSNVLNATIQLC